MKQKTLLVALLALSFAFGPCLCGKLEFPVPVADLAFTLSRPFETELFWRICDAVRSHLVAQSHPSFSSEAVVFGEAVSISQYLVRR